jgi:hypothetical protein
VNGIRKAWAMVRRALRCAHTLARSNKLPRWLRILFIIGCVQIPVLPVDELALLAAIAIMAVFYRPTLRAAWADSANRKG